LVTWRAASVLGKRDGHSVIAMEFLDGMTLKHRLGGRIESTGEK
jgi:hypothetical protein